jgi:hypothetical protein
VSRHRFTAAAAALLSVGALGASALVGTSADARPAAHSTVSARAAALPNTAVTIGLQHRVRMPATLRPGVRVFNLTSGTPAGVQFFKLKPGYTLQQWGADAAVVFNGQDLVAINRWYNNTVFVGGTTSRPGHPGKFITKLAAGTYYALDFLFEGQAPITTFKVAGEPTTGTASWNATITAVTDKWWDRTPASVPRLGIIRFVNRARSPHFMELQKLKPGKTYAQAKACIEQGCSEQKAATIFDFKVSADEGLVSPGHSYEFKYSLPTGNYIVACFMPDRKTGMPHAVMGMTRPLTVR